MQIIPAIIGKDFDEVKKKIKRIEGLVEWIQVDVMDGIFTEALSWQCFDLPGRDNLKVELHLMVKDPQINLDKWLEVGVDRILIHYESTDEKKLEEILDELNDAEVEAGIALKLETPIDVIDTFIDKIDVVQLMSIATIGSYGQPFDERVYDKIRSLRAKYPGVTIEIDGGVSLDNAQKLIDAGADNLVVGSAIFKSKDIEETINNFKSLERRT